LRREDSFADGPGAREDLGPLFHRCGGQGCRPGCGIPARRAGPRGRARVVGVRPGEGLPGLLRIPIDST